MKTPVDISLIREGAKLPRYETPGAVAFDLAICEDRTIAPGTTEIIPTGVVIRVPDACALILAARSSNAKKGLMLANGIGVIDQDYCGPTDELHLAIYNAGSAPYQAQAGERLAQGLLVPVARAFFQEKTPQGPSRGGFGSTG